MNSTGKKAANVQSQPSQFATRSIKDGAYSRIGRPYKRDPKFYRPPSGHFEMLVRTNSVPIPRIIGHVHKHLGPPPDCFPGNSGKNNLIADQYSQRPIVQIDGARRSAGHKFHVTGYKLLHEKQYPREWNVFPEGNKVLLKPRQFSVPSAMLVVFIVGFLSLLFASLGGQPQAGFTVVSLIAFAIWIAYSSWFALSNIWNNRR